MELFESSWEVCNKVGGIHTVLATKSDNIKEHIKNHTYIGPYRGHAQGEFAERKVPKKFEQVFENLKSQGIVCHYGQWKIKSKPKAILIDFNGIVDQKNEIKTKLWDNYGIDSLHSQWEFDEPILWSTAVGKFLEEYSKNKKNVIAHFHEWMAGAAILYLKSIKSNVKTVFTTHATILGRTMSSNYRDLYKEIENVDPENEARQYNIQDKHLTEKACAWNCDVFTTVSEITGLESKHLLKRKPDVLLLNGIDSDDIKPTRDGKIKNLIKNVFPNVSSETFVIFTSGRYEFHDKGMDTFISALGDLNRSLKNNVVALFLVPVQNWGVKKEYKENPVNLMCTHYLHDEYNDVIIKNLRENGMENEEDDKVKVLFIPSYINENDGFFNTSYYEIVSECDLGVFPSIYEPWGYTPLECAALGVPSITTMDGGFGRFIKPFTRSDECDGVFVLDSNNIFEELKSTLAKFLDREKQRCELNKINALGLAQRASWTKFVKNYLKAYELAQKA